MARFIVDLFLDEGDTKEEHDRACVEFIHEQLNFAGSTVKIIQIEEEINEP